MVIFGCHPSCQCACLWWLSPPKSGQFLEQQTSTEHCCCLEPPKEPFSVTSNSLHPAEWCPGFFCGWRWASLPSWWVLVCSFNPTKLNICLGFFLKRRYRFFIVCQSIRCCQSNYLKSWCPEVSSFQISFSADWLLFVIENRPYKQEPLHHFTQATLVKARVGLLCISDGAQTKQVSHSVSWLQNIHFTFPSQEDLLLQGAAALAAP